MNARLQRLVDFLQFAEEIFVCDVGASLIAETPVYSDLVKEYPAARLYAFDGDERHIAGLRERYGDKASVINRFLYDGSEQTAYICDERSGMTSLLKPDEKALSFFNGFSRFGEVISTEAVSTTRLDDVEEVDRIHFLKMDIQGAELTVLANGAEKLRDCIAIQLEVSHICLYEDQPTFGDIDRWMRSAGYAPHCFLRTKRWSISPLTREGDIRKPFNQLLESDIVYIRDPIVLDRYTDSQLKLQALFATLCFNSPDLAVHCIGALADRGCLPADAAAGYLEAMKKT